MNLLDYYIGCAAEVICIATVNGSDVMATHRQSELMLKAVIPKTSGLVPIAVLPSIKVTVPVGIPLPI